MQKFIILIILGFLLSGCVANEPAPLPEIIPPIRIAMTPANSYVALAANTCVQEIPGVVITIDTLPINEIDSLNYDIMLTSGEGLTNWQYQLMEEKLVFIVNSSNPIQNLTRAQIQQILGGYITDWNEIKPETPANSLNKKIQVYLFAENDDVTNLVMDQLPEDIIINVRTRYVPGVPEMTQAILSDPEGIGVIPARWLTDSVKPLSTDMNITYPIVMSVQKDPTGLLRDLMACIQLKVATSEK